MSSKKITKSISIDYDTSELIKEGAEQTGRTYSSFVNWILNRFLKEDINNNKEKEQ